MQVGLSALYAALQRLPEDVCSQCDASDALDSVKRCAFAALHSDNVIKEAAVSAAGTLWVVALLRFQVSPEVLAVTFACGLFHTRLSGCTLQLPCTTVAGESQSSISAGKPNEVCHKQASPLCISLGLGMNEIVVSTGNTGTVLANINFNLQHDCQVLRLLHLPVIWPHAVVCIHQLSIKHRAKHCMRVCDCADKFLSARSDSSEADWACPGYACTCSMHASIRTVWHTAVSSRSISEAAQQCDSSRTQQRHWR